MVPSDLFEARLLFGKYRVGRRYNSTKTRHMWPTDRPPSLRWLYTYSRKYAYTHFLLCICVCKTTIRAKLLVLCNAFIHKRMLLTHPLAFFFIFHHHHHHTFLLNYDQIYSHTHKLDTFRQSLETLYIITYFTVIHIRKSRYTICVCENSFTHCVYRTRLQFNALLEGRERERKLSRRV